MVQLKIIVLICFLMQFTISQSINSIANQLREEVVKEFSNMTQKCNTQQLQFLKENLDRMHDNKMNGAYTISNHKINECIILFSLFNLIMTYFIF